MWEDLLPSILFGLNTSVNASTGFSPYELRFGRPPPTLFPQPTEYIPITLNGGKDFIKKHAAIIEDAKVAIHLAQARIKMYYDQKRQDFVLEKDNEVFLKLAKSTGDGYKLLQN
jgi:hypothetical protein